MSAACIMATSFAPSPIASMRRLMLLREFWTLRSTVLGSSIHLAIGCLSWPLCGPCFSCGQQHTVSTQCTRSHTHAMMLATCCRCGKTAGAVGKPWAYCAAELGDLEALHHAHDGGLLGRGRPADDHAAAHVGQLRQQRLMVRAQDAAQGPPIDHHLRGVALQRMPHSQCSCARRWLLQRLIPARAPCSQPAHVALAAMRWKLWLGCGQESMRCWA